MERIEQKLKRFQSDSPTHLVDKRVGEPEYKQLYFSRTPGTNPFSVEFFFQKRQIDFGLGLSVVGWDGFEEGL